MRTKTQNRESIEPKSRVPVSARQREERRKSSAGKIMKAPAPAMRSKKDAHPPKKRMDYFAYINDFLKENGKDIPFPNRVKSYDPTSYAKAATGILSLIDPSLKEINRNSLEREFCDILDIIGYPYNVRDCVHSIPTNHNYQFTLDPLRWLVSLITTYNQYLTIPIEEKMYDEQTQKWLQVLNVFIEAYGLWLQGRDEEVERLTSSAFTCEVDEEEKINQTLQNQFKELQEQLELISKGFDTSMEGNVQSLEIELQKKKSDFDNLVKERDKINALITDLGEQIQDYEKIYNESIQKENDITTKINNLPYDLSSIETMLNKPDLIKKEIDEENNNIKKMKEQINDNENQFKTQCEALILIANDLNGIASQLNIENSITINDEGEATGELFGTDIDEIVLNILSQKPDINMIQNENAKIIAERNEIDKEMMDLKQREEDLLKEINSIKDSNGKDVDKINKKLSDIQKENQKLTREIQNNDDSVNGLFTRLDEKLKSVSSHISNRFAEYLEELRKVQEEM